MVAIDATSSRRAVCFEVVNYLIGIGVYQTISVSSNIVLSHILWNIGKLPCACL